jgi:hypothetical protein
LVIHANHLHTDLHTLACFPLLPTPSKRCTLIASRQPCTVRKSAPCVTEPADAWAFHALQGTFLPANVSEQLDDMTSHTTLVAAAAKVKHHYDKLRTWRSSLLKESSQDLAGAVAADDIGTEIENVLKR